MLLLLGILFSQLTIKAQSTEPMPYNPCPPNLNLSASCYGGAGTCYTYGQYPCSPGYCWDGGGIPDNAGIPTNGIVENKTIEIAGVYTITQNVRFINCIFKMHGDARINISPVGNVLMKISFINCNFFGCNEMWQGIIINASGATGKLYFTFGSCNVEDAYIGLKLDEMNAGYSIVNNTFRNNHIGISNLRQNGSILNAAIVQNTFLQTASLANRVGSLAPPFIMLEYPLAYAGIKYSQVTTVIGEKNTPNIFSCLTYGLISTSSTVLSINNTFQDIILNGILAIDGTISATDCRFQLNGYIAISATGSNLTAHFNTFNGAWIEGIESFQNANAEQISIVENNFNIDQNTWVFGITIDRPQNNQGVKCLISQNIFTMDADPSSFFCIDVSDLVDATNVAEISLNNITFNSAETFANGIYVHTGNSDNLLIDNNTVYAGTISTLPNSNKGITIISNEVQTLSTGHVVKGNTCTAIPADLAIGENAMKHGIYIHNIKNMDICENTVDQTLIGFDFHAINDVKFRENYINHHDVGLSILAEIGIQYGKGNNWSLDPNACVNGAAKVLLGNPLKSEFIVPEGNVLPWLPPNAKLHPDPNNINWFHEGNVPLDYCEQLFEVQQKTLTHDEIEMVGGTSTLSGTELWELKRDVYTKLLIFPELRPIGSPEETFFNNLSSTTIASFGQITQQIRNALYISTPDQVVLDAYRTSIWLIFEELSELDGSIDYSNPENLANEWYDQRSMLLLQAATNAGYEMALENARSQQLNIMLQSVLSNNAGIVASFPYESARKILNELRIRRLLGQPITLALYQQALSIAQANPATIGYATEEVVSFLAHCDQTLYRSDDENNHKAINVKKGPFLREVYTLQVTPNPTTDIAEVNLRNRSGLLTVYNLHGQEMKTQIIAPDMSTVYLDFTSNSAGLYWVVLTDQTGSIIGTAKISVSH